MVLQQVWLQRQAERRARKSWQRGLAAHTRHSACYWIILVHNTFKVLQRANARCAHAHLSTIYACCQDGMTGTSPAGRSDGTRGQKPAYSYREATLVNLTKNGI